MHLVGAGPGDPGLLSARALQLIACADVILYDRLIPEEALSGARADAELLYVGKEGGGQSVPQEQTERVMVGRALAGSEVVRLKGGDPFVFGRGGEEALALRRAGVPFTVVPGVSAGIAASAYAGIPITHRGLARAVAFVTGSTEDGEQGRAEDELDWESIARFDGTLVFYMSVRKLKQTTAHLIENGRPPQEPAAIIENGTLPSQRVLLSTLGEIADEARAAGVKAPATVLFGEVANLSKQLSWYGADSAQSQPLTGVSVAVTRARAQASALTRRLRQLGAEVVEAPSIRIMPLEAEIPDLSAFELLCLTSENGANLLFDALNRSGRDARALAHLTVAAIGPGTARALEARGIIADVVPKRYVAEGLIEALEGFTFKRALIARAREGRDTLQRALEAAGTKVDVVALYETVAEQMSDAETERARNANYITFTSSSTVTFFLHTAGNRRSGGAAPLSRETRIVSIGPVTSATLEEHGLKPHVEAGTHDIDGVIDALLADVRGR